MALAAWRRWWCGKATSANQARRPRRSAPLGVRQLETRLTPSTLVSLASFGSPNGAYPYAGLVMDSGGNLYGCATQGGPHGDGTVFEIKHGGSTITTLAAFDGTDGQQPEGTLILDASGNLYGTTYSGGANKDGTVFELAKGSSTITTLASFGSSTGQNPVGGVVLDAGGNLYGTTYGGGANGLGTVFEVVAGSGAITTLASFDGTNSGQNPQAGVILDAGGNLYGTAYGGGANGDGTVFEVVAGSGAITALASFDSTNGSNPYAGLVMDGGGNLFGTAAYGGASGDGTVYEVVAGSGTVTALASFNYTDGADPYGGLVMDSGGNLFGTTAYGGGGSSTGTVFEVANGSNTITMLSPMIYPGGIVPQAGVVLDAGGNLYGTCQYGGVGYGGTVFELAKGATQVTTLASFSNNGADPFGGMVIDSKGNLYGTTAYGGAQDSGTIFEIAAGSTTVTTLASFGGIYGQYPYGNVLMDGSGNLWGTTWGGGLHGDGTIWELQSGQTAITMVASFSSSTGINPQCGLVVDGSGNMFGTTTYGGASGYGTIWELPARRAGGIINVIASFNGTDGEYPASGLAIDGSGNMFGTTPQGGASGYGTVFEVAKGTNTINTLASFDYNNTGGYSYANLIVDGSGNLYGTASSGGTGGNGTVFEVVKGSGVITPLASFNYNNGAYPYAGLIMDGKGNLYGTASYGGPNYAGTVFTVVKGSGTITTVADFNYTDGGYPYAPLVMDSKGILYGTTAYGGTSYNGTVFEVVPPDQWTGANSAVDTNWSDGANWSLGVPPAAGQQVNFTNDPSVLGFTSTVDAGFTNTIGDLDIDGLWGGTITANSALNVGGNLNLASGSLGGAAAVSVAGTASDWTGGQIVVGAGGFTNNGTFLADTTAGNLVITGAGALTNTGTMNEGGGNSLELENNAVLSNAKGATFDITATGGISQSGGGAVVNAGLLEKTSTGVTTIASTSLSNTGNVEVTHGTLNISAAVSQASGKTLTGGAWTVSAIGTEKVKLDITSDHILNTLGDHAKVTLSGVNATFASLSKLATIASGASLNLQAGASFTTLGALTDGGSLSLGAGSVLTVSGNFDETSTGAMTVQIGGTRAAPTVGELVSTTGTVTLGGSLTVTAKAVPAMRSSLEVLDNGGDAAIVGTFSGLPEGTILDVTKGTRTLHFKISYVGTDADGSENVVLTRVR